MYICIKTGDAFPCWTMKCIRNTLMRPWFLLSFWMKHLLCTSHSLVEKCIKSWGYVTEALFRAFSCPEMSSNKHCSVSERQYSVCLSVSVCERDSVPVLILELYSSTHTHTHTKRLLHGQPSVYHLPEHLSLSFLILSSLAINSMGLVHLW